MQDATIRRRRLVGASFALLALLTATSGHAAQDQKRANTASSGGFSVMQIATTEPDLLMAAWQKPAPGVALPSATRAKRNQPIVTFLVFAGCRPDPAGACNVTADFVTYAPSGAIYDQTRGAKIWVGLPAPIPPGLQLSANALGLVFENKDPLGDYRVSVDVTDHIAGTTLHTEQVLTAAE